MKYSSKTLAQEFPLLSLVSVSYMQKQLFLMYAYSEVVSVFYFQQLFHYDSFEPDELHRIPAYWYCSSTNFTCICCQSQMQCQI